MTVLVNENEDEFCLERGKEREGCENMIAQILWLLDAISRLTDQIDKLVESLKYEREMNDLLREDNF